MNPTHPDPETFADLRDFEISAAIAHEIKADLYGWLSARLRNLGLCRTRLSAWATRNQKRHTQRARRCRGRAGKWDKESREQELNRIFKPKTKWRS